jgi:hypothetical protein
MKHGKDVRDPRGRPRDRNAAKEIPSLMFVMFEKSPGAFQLRFVSNDDLLHDLQERGALQTFLDDADRLLCGISQPIPRSTNSSTPELIGVSVQTTPPYPPNIRPEV